MQYQSLPQQDKSFDFDLSRRFNLKDEQSAQLPWS